MMQIKKKNKIKQNKIREKHHVEVSKFLPKTNTIGKSTLAKTIFK